MARHSIRNGCRSPQHELCSCTIAFVSSPVRLCYHARTFVTPSLPGFPMSDRSTRLSLLQQALKERILILDGGMGTMIQSYKLDEADYRGERFADWPQDVKGN